MDKYFNKNEFEGMRRSISQLKTEYQKVGDDPEDRVKRLDHSAFGANEHSESTSAAVIGHLNGVKESYDTAQQRLEEIERALDAVYESNLDAEHANQHMFTPKD